MDALTNQPTRGDIIRTLQNLPQGLDETYAQTMKRISNQGSGFREMAKKVLSWVIRAKRTLSITELQHALAVEPGKRVLNKDFIPELDIIGSICAGLITIDVQNNIVRLVHYTTQEYFERTWISWLPHAETYIATTCLTYLLFDDFSDGRLLKFEDFERRLRENVLYSYAAQNWGYHAFVASTEALPFIMDLLESEAKISAFTQAFNIFPDRYRFGSRPTALQKMTGVHLAAYFGLREAMIGLIKNGHSPHAKDIGGKTPLTWAAENGHKVIVEHLLIHEGVEPDSKDTYGKTPLSWAAAKGHQEVVKLLLLVKDGVDPDFKNNTFGQTPIALAAQEGHEAVVKQLLRKPGVNPNSKDSWGRTPLRVAAENGHWMVAKLLLMNGDIESDVKDTMFRLTPLWWCAKLGNEELVKRLVEDHDADVNFTDKFNRTALLMAAKNGHKAVVEILLAKGGIALDLKDNLHGRTPLSWAAGLGHEAIVELLLTRGGIDINSKDLECGWTPLSWAAAYGYDRVVKLLLAESGIDPDSNGALHSRTPLSYAAGKGHEAILKLLLSNDSVKPDTKSRSGRTPLSWAAEEGNALVVGLLLAKDNVDPNSKDNLYGRTPLSWAAGKGNTAVVELLLAKDGIDLDSKDHEFSQSALSWARENGHKEVVAQLLHCRLQKDITASARCERLAKEKAQKVQTQQQVEQQTQQQGGKEGDENVNDNVKEGKKISRVMPAESGVRNSSNDIILSGESRRRSKCKCLCSAVILIGCYSYRNSDSILVIFSTSSSSIECTNHVIV